MSENEINNLHRQLETISERLSELNNTLVEHITEERDYKPALQDLVVLWKASKIIIPGAVLVWAFIVWVKDHVRI